MFFMSADVLIMDIHQMGRLSWQKVSVVWNELTTIFVHQKISITIRDDTKRRFHHVQTIDQQ